MNLSDALRQIATAGGLDADALIAFAAEDHIGGRDTGAWDSMSTFEAEGQVIYALVRALRPPRVLEIGVASGGTSTHILSALEANGEGELYSIDIEANCGLNVPERLRHRWTYVVGDALTVDLPGAVMIWEDGAHTLEFSAPMLERLKALAPRLICSHDYATGKVYGGFFVKEAFDAVLPEGFGIEIDGCFTGLGVWFNPNWQVPQIESEPELEQQSIPAKKAPAKRKAAKRA